MSAVLLTIKQGIKLSPGVTVKVPTLPLTTDGLVLHYDFSNPTCYPGTGVAVIDLSTASNSGAVVNDYGHISYVSDGDNSYFNWLSSGGGGGDPNAVGGSIHTTSTSVYRDFTIILQPDFTIPGMGGIICVPGDKSLRVYNSSWTFPNPGNDDDWAASSVGATTFYVNGQASNQMVTGWNIIGGATTNPAFLTAKQLYIGTSGYGNRHMQGKIAVVLMYNRVLTEQEHLVNYNHYKLRFGLGGVGLPLKGIQHTIAETEEEIVNQETILNYYDTLTIADRSALTASLRTTELAILAREKAELKAQHLASGVPTGLTREHYSTSAWQIKQDYPDSEDGVYWIQNDDINSGNPFAVYCDMTTLGGGWTLVVQNTYCDWTEEQVFSRNATACPTQLAQYDTRATEQNYSILSWANKIKRAESGFDFMITAREHGTRGGAWTANEAYSFTQTLEEGGLGDPDLGTPGWRKNITELAHWGTWNYQSESMEARMPWIGIGINYGWLTTDGFRGGWWGTLISNPGGGFDPAPWMSNEEGAQNPGIIWYWVR